MNKTIKLDSVLRLALLPAVGLACLIAIYFVVRWYAGNTLATTTPYEDIAEYAVSLAPDDARTHYTLAVLLDRSFIAEDLPKSLAEYEKAVALSPNDYRYWSDLGRARERSGDFPGAEKALRKALELAPNYSNIHWTLGNLLLREGSTEEAFAEMRRAVENDPNYANPAVSTVWNFFGGDASLLAQKIGDSPSIKSALAVFLARQNRFDEALALWNSLTKPDDDAVYKENGQTILQLLIGAKRFRDALTLKSQLEPSTAAKFAVGKISNGNFEAAISQSNTDIFDWKIADGLQPQIGFDEQQKYAGSRSLVVVFNSSPGKDFRSIEQTTAVESNKHYTFETFARSDLKSQATVRWDVLDAADNKVLASTAAVANSSDWSPLTAEFTTAPATQAVIFRLTRVPCPTSICPISGKVWFDDFSLR